MIEEKTFCAIMSEIVVIILVLALGLLLPWISGWDPEILLWTVTVVLNLMNLGMTAINWIQARRRDPRFLDAWLLGLVQIAVGLALLGVFLPTLGARPETWWAGIPFLAGGSLVLLRRGASPSQS